MAVSLNVANSIVDYLRSKGQASDFGTRKEMYRGSGLESTFGSFVGSASQNTALLKQMQDRDKAAPPPVAPVAPAAPTVNQVQQPLVQAPAQQQADPLTEAINRRRSALEEASAQYAPELQQAQDDVVGEYARGAAALPEQVGATRAAGVAATADEKRKEIAARLAAESNLASRGITSTSGIAAGQYNEVARAGKAGQEEVAARTTQDIQKTLADAEKQYGTDFIKALGIPEAESFANLPASIRGTLMQQYERERQTLQGKVLSEANRIQSDAQKLESDIAARGEKAAQAEERLLNLRLKIKAGEAFEFQGETFTGLKDDDPDVQIIQKEDAKGNVTVIGLDKNTGKELYKETYAGIGTPTKSGSSGSSSGSTTSRSTGGSTYSFTADEKRTLQRANITDADASVAFLEAPSAFRSWLITNMVLGGSALRREDVIESLKWWEQNVKNKASSSSGDPLDKYYSS